MKVKGSYRERNVEQARPILRMGAPVAVKDVPMFCSGRSALKHRSGGMVASVQKIRLPRSIAILMAILLSFCSRIVFAQTELMESKVSDGIKATLVVTPSKSMVDLILSDAKTGKSITSAKVSALIKGPDGKVIEKELMGVKMGEEFSFMNTLDMSRKGRYSFDITVEVKNKSVKFNFVYEVK